MPYATLQSSSLASAADLHCGRFLTPDRTTHDCQVRNLTMNGATLTDCAVIADNTRIVIYMDGIGRFEADVIASYDYGMDVKFVPAKCRLEALRSYLAARNTAKLIKERRRHCRIDPATTLKQFSLPDGQILDCEVVNISLSGALLKLDAFLPIGTTVRLQGWSGRVADRRDDGLVIKFHNELDPAAIAELAC